MPDSFDGLGRKRKTACKYGHPFDGTERIAVNWKGYGCRVCRECERQRIQRKRENPNYKKREAASTAKWRKKHPERYRESYRRAYQERDQWIQSFKTQCKFCGESRFPCLDFHHRDSTEKMATIAQVRHWPKDKLLAEINKCDIVCANCHRWHHYEESLKRKEGE